MRIAFKFGESIASEHTSEKRLSTSLQPLKVSTIEMQILILRVSEQHINNYGKSYFYGKNVRIVNMKTNFVSPG